MIVISQSSVRSNELGVVKPTRVGCSDDIEVFTFTRSKPIVQYDSVIRRLDRLKHIHQENLTISTCPIV